MTLLTERVDYYTLLGDKICYTAVDNAAISPPSYSYNIAPYYFLFHYNTTAYFHKYIAA